MQAPAAHRSLRGGDGIGTANDRGPKTCRSQDSGVAARPLRSLGWSWRPAPPAPLFFRAFAQCVFFRRQQQPATFLRHRRALRLASLASLGLLLLLGVLLPARVSASSLGALGDGDVMLSIPMPHTRRLLQTQSGHAAGEAPGVEYCTRDAVVSGRAPLAWYAAAADVLPQYGLSQPSLVTAGYPDQAYVYQWQGRFGDVLAPANSSDFAARMTRGEDPFFNTRLPTFRDRIVSFDGYDDYLVHSSAMSHRHGEGLGSLGSRMTLMVAFRTASQGVGGRDGRGGWVLSTNDLFAPAPTGPVGLGL